MRTPARVAALLVLAPVVAVGCGSDGSDGSTGSSGSGAPDGDRPVVVASTTVWASVARAVGGDAVTVEAIVDSPSADPHSYESTPADAARVAGADLVVLNGGGYDEFMEQVLETQADTPAVEAFALAGEGESGHDHEGEEHAGEEHEGEESGQPQGSGPVAAAAQEHEGANEHVWYDLPTVEAVAEEVAGRLGELLPDRAATFTGNAEAFATEIDGVAAAVEEIAAAHAGDRVALTEPLAVHLIEAAGLADATPPEFAEAVEEETDPPPAAVAEIDELVTGGEVAALVDNTQTATPVTDRVRAAAEGTGVPVVEMAETLPEGVEYVEWMSGQVDALAAALGRATRGRAAAPPARPARAATGGGRRRRPRRSRPG